VGEARDYATVLHGIRVTVDTTLAFMPPRARLEYSFSLRAASIRRTPEESFRDEVVLARV